MKLNPAQTEAVLTTEGRLLILAGAGTGKTRVIVHRIAHLVETKKGSPEEILALTFTNKASKEMKHRLQALLGAAQSQLISISTFHSFCMQLLRKEIDKIGFTKDFSLYDEQDIERLLKQLAREMLGIEGELPSMAQTKGLLAKAAQMGFSSQAPSQFWKDPFSKQIHERLQSLLRSYNALNFDNLINMTIALFEERPDVLQKVQERYRYLMVDEYQDTNGAQFRLLEMLAQKSNNLCVVGDDDQSIYGWRGAIVENILAFKADKTIKLEQNYRSSPLILQAANAVIGKNQKRHPKTLWSSKKEGPPLEIFNAATEMEEAQAIVQRIVSLKKEKGYGWKQFAVLYRSNALSRSIESALMQASWESEGKWMRGIPYEVFGGLEFTERSEIKDLLAYLRSLANPKDEEALLRILNVPRRGISDPFLEELTQMARKEKRALIFLLQEIAKGKQSFPSHPKGVKGIGTFIACFEKAQKRFETESLAETLRWFIEEIDYKKAIEEDVKSEKMRSFKWENVEECISLLAEYEQNAPLPSLADFVGTTALGKSSLEIEGQGGKKEAVQLMTLHSAKGLEFPVCFLMGLEDHILPHEKSREETGIEEERRLFYVGMTRAEEKLILSMARARLKMGKAHPTTPSRFLFEIPKNLLHPTNP